MCALVESYIRSQYLNHLVILNFKDYVSFFQFYIARFAIALKHANQSPVR